MLTAHCGMRKRKLIVPSSGSTTQRSPVVPSLVAALLAQEAVARPRLGQALADQPLGGVVGLGDEVGRARLRGHVHERAGERVAQLVPRLARDRLGDLAQRRRLTAPPAAARASRARGLELGGEREQRRLAVRRHDELGADSGKPSAVAPPGTDAAGWPVWLNGAAVRHEAHRAGERPQPPSGPRTRRTRGARRVNIGVITSVDPALEDAVERRTVGRGRRLRDRSTNASGIAEPSRT